MRQIITFTLLCILYTGIAKASHIFGGELYYEHLTGNNYRINLALFGDCAGSAFPNLYNYPIRISILRNGVQVDSMILAMDADSVKEITPVCSAYKDSTTCKGLSNKIIGVTKFVYHGDIIIPNTSAIYTFVFDGGLNNAGRTNNITNIFLAQQTQIYLEAELNTAVFNSSPKFTTVPTPFYCINVPQSFNQGAVDADNDSLVFELANALNSGGTPAVYSSGYSAQVPIESGGYFEFNAVNGQMDFTPSILQNSVVVNKVREYRHGQLAGTSMREMTFVVIGNCNNLPVETSVDSSETDGGLLSGGNVFNVCAEAPLAKFRYDFADPDGDTVDLTVLALPTGASLTISGNGTPNAVVDFSWNTTSIPAGNYTFFVTAKDRHCPLSTTQTKAFTIRIVNQNEVSHTVIKPTQCAHKAVLQFSVAQGLAPRTFTLRHGSVVVRTFSDTVATFLDSLYAGAYSLTVASRDLLCPTTYDFVVVDSGIFPYSPLFNNNVVCSGEDTGPLEAIAFSGATLHWFDINGNALPIAPTPSSAVFSTQYWLISQLYKACESLKDTVKVVVIPKPEIRLLSDTGSICVGEQVFLKATGAPYFDWLPKEKLFYEPDSSIFIRVYQPEEFTVIGHDTIGCSDTIHFRYTNILQCCTFSYPTAFTPNNDGKNDSWRPVVYGTQDHYELSIYNRWGQILFHSFIPNEAWDGKYEGAPQEIGSYHYLLRAKCVTGKEETKAGDFMLMR